MPKESPWLSCIDAANTHDGTLLQQMVDALPAIKSQRGPRRRTPGRLRAERSDDYDIRRRWLRTRGIVPRIPRRGIDRKDRRGRDRWKIERDIGWLTGYQRLTTPLRTPCPTLRSIPSCRSRADLLQKTPRLRHCPNPR